MHTISSDGKGNANYILQLLAETIIALHKNFVIANFHNKKARQRKKLFRISKDHQTNQKLLICSQLFVIYSIVFSVLWK